MTLPHLKARIAELVAEGDGFWRSCSGCYETEDGHPVGTYPFSQELGCPLGGGCRECGGIGATWDSTDYADMAEWMLERDKLHDRLKAAAGELQGFVDRRRLPSLGATTRAIDALAAAVEDT